MAKKPAKTPARRGGPPGSSVKRTPAATKTIAKKKATAPNSSALVLEAVRGLAARGGSSLVAIKKFIASQYTDLAAGWERRVTSSVRLLVSKLQLVQLKGSFRLPGGAAKPAKATPSKSPSKSPSKKAAASPKPAAKKVPASAVKKVVGKKPSGAAKKKKQAGRKA